MEPTIRVVLTDPHPVVISGLRSFLSGHKDIEVVGDCSEMRSAPQIAVTGQADVLLVGHSPDEAGWKLLSRLRHANGSFIAVMAMTAARDGHTLCEALRGGCRGVYDKTDLLDHLPVAIRTVNEGSLWFRDKDAHQVIESLLQEGRTAAKTRKNSDQLTERQQRIVSLVARGLANAEIAEAVRVSQATVALDLTRIYKRFGVPDRVRLLLKIRSEGYPEVPAMAPSDPPEFSLGTSQSLGF